jgi:hypothetical protein
LALELFTADLQPQLANKETASICPPDTISGTAITVDARRYKQSHLHYRQVIGGKWKIRGKEEMGNLAIHSFIEASYEEDNDWRQRKRQNGVKHGTALIR